MQSRKRPPERTRRFARLVSKLRHRRGCQAQELDAFLAGLRRPTAQTRFKASMLSAANPPHLE